MSTPQEEWVPLFAAHEKIYPRSVTGKFTSLRWVTVWLTQLVFYGVPWLALHNRQAVLFDLVHRRFYIGPFVFYPQDFIYLTGLLIICALSLFLFTAVAGRVWCGYSCPQTVYTEMFLWVERKIEGDRIARMRLDEHRWSLSWMMRKVGKHGVWLLIGLWTGFTFVGYFTPIRDLWAELQQWSVGPWETFWVLFYGFATYGNAGFMREQVCKYMCPYARFQSAMFDKDTLVISYDKQRGDPRGSRSRKAERNTNGLGDCIDCTLCVQVCPTGIDIRNGLQYECIGCAACIDVCDTVMEKMSYPKGLIRYTTQHLLENKTPVQTEVLKPAGLLKQIFRPRVIIYTALVWMLIAAMGITLAMRHDIKVDVVRDRGVSNRIVEDGQIENVYRLQVMNTTERPLQVDLAVQLLDGSYIDSETRFMVPAAQSKWVPVRLRTAVQLSPGSHAFEFVVKASELDGSVKVSDAIVEKAVFIMPRQ